MPLYSQVPTSTYRTQTAAAGDAGLTSRPARALNSPPGTSRPLQRNRTPDFAQRPANHVRSSSVNSHSDVQSSDSGFSHPPVSFRVGRPASVGSRS
ncbi:unnamed protein product, partial [Nesidiocoris tenuis]